jgi:serine-type D-Ala-D-Ala carboxypeptidase/endopeptidase (penicillin-binding protein 4)
MMKKLGLHNCIIAIALLISACSTTKKSSQTANFNNTNSINTSSNAISVNPQDALLNSADLSGAHIGISVYDPSNKTYLYNYQGDKYFIPASNTKIMSCYVAMKYLGDSLVGLRYVDKGNGMVEVEANADPSFLYPDFPKQPVYEFLKKQKTVLLTNQNWNAKGWGRGWSWDDYESDYMAQRSMMPIYGNVVVFKKGNKAVASVNYFQQLVKNETVINDGLFDIKREIGANHFTVVPATKTFTGTDIPFYTDDTLLLTNLLRDTLKTNVKLSNFKLNRLPDVVKIHTQPTDSLLKIMMHRSDNFFAEQCLLMASNELLGEMNTAKLIDTILKTDFKGLPQKPKWVDGSGLSRYNLFSPQDFITVLDKMRNEFAWNRITTIFSSGGNGTISGYYKNSAGKIYAKTGTLSNNVALSGYLITQKGNTLLFSILVSNHTGNVSNIRKSVEQFLNTVMENQ